MCLTTVTSTQTEEIEGIGWKVVGVVGRIPDQNEEENNEFYFIYGPGGFRTYPYNQWLERVDWQQYNMKMIKLSVSLPKFQFPNYPIGFHIFLTKQDAMTYAIDTCSAWNAADRFVVKVKYKTILAKGTQDGSPCVVTQFLYVEKPCA